MQKMTRNQLKEENIRKKRKIDDVGEKVAYTSSIYSINTDDEFTNKKRY